MKTLRLQPDAVKQAADILRKGGLVAFPTETVYGLGADGLNPVAVAKIYQAKGRPSDNPLILHICDDQMLEQIVSSIPDTARRLMQAFWPGPLTLVFPKSQAVPELVSAKLATVAVRMPAHALALALIRETNRPIAAPSANTSTRPSPTKASHVLHDLDGRIEAILLGEDCLVGMESTIVDVSVPVPCLLRPGGITVEELRIVLPELIVNPGLLSMDVSQPNPKAPGMKYRHYAPDAQVILLTGSQQEQYAQLLDYIRLQDACPCGLLASEEFIQGWLEKKNNMQISLFSLGSRETDRLLGQQIYDLLRQADQRGIRTLLAESLSETGMGHTVMNRLKKAAGEQEKGAKK